MTIASTNPATGDTWRSYQEMGPMDVAEAIDGAHEAFVSWRETSFAHRAKRMRRAAEILRERQDELANLMAREMGKPIREGRSEVEKCAWVCEHYAENAEAILAPQHVETEYSKSYVAFEPLGVVLAVMPWNFPLWQVFRFAAPGLMAGNAGILKHASNVPGCALAIEEIFGAAGFPGGLFQSVLVGSSQVPDIIDHPKVRAVTLTGSTPAGKAVAKRAGKALKKTVLELGGSDPYLILEDADLDEAVPLCVTSRLLNGGQSCIAAKRFIVPRSLQAAFEERLVKQMTAKVMGDPLNEETDLGPQARNDLRDDLHKQVEESVAKGALLLAGGEIPNGPGAFYPPTVLSEVRPGMPAYDDELFGPVAAVIAVENVEEAIRVANDTNFGLGAAVFTQDRLKGEEVARRLDAGCCFVNEFVKSDPRLPFGGVKDSGYGRELSAFGIREFVNVKTVVVK